MKREIVGRAGNEMAVVDSHRGLFNEPHFVAGVIRTEMRPMTVCHRLGTFHTAKEAADVACAALTRIECRAPSRLVTFRYYTIRNNVLRCGHQQRRTQMTTIEAKTLGSNAYLTGRSVDTNPFRDGTEEAKQFASAWKKAHREVSAAATKNYKEGKRTFRNSFNS